LFNESKTLLLIARPNLIIAAGLFILAYQPNTAARQA